MSAVIYIEATGEITSSFEGPADHIALQCGEGESYVIGEGADDTHYVELTHHSIKPKQDYTLEALPLPCTVEIEGVRYPVEGQPDFEFDAPGRYEIEVDAGPAYLRKTFYVDQA